MIRKQDRLHSRNMRTVGVTNCPEWSRPVPRNATAEEGAVTRDPPFGTVVGVAQPAGRGAPVGVIGTCPATCPLGGVCPGTAAGLRASDQRGRSVLGRCARVAGGAGCGRRLSYGCRL